MRWKILNKKIKRRLIYLLLGLVLLICFFYFQNNSIVTTQYNFSSDKVPQNFNVPFTASHHTTERAGKPLND